MKWSEVREMYPNKFIKFEVLDSHIDGAIEIVDDIALIGVMTDGKEAMKEYLKCIKGQYIYSTSKERVEIQMVKYIGVRGEV